MAIIKGGLVGPTGAQLTQSALGGLSQGMSNLQGFGNQLQRRREAKQEAALPTYESVLESSAGDPAYAARQQADSVFQYYNTLYGPRKAAQMTFEQASGDLGLEAKRQDFVQSVIRGESALDEGDLKIAVEQAEESGDIQAVSDYITSLEAGIKAMGENEDTSELSQALANAQGFSDAFDPELGEFSFAQYSPTSKALLKLMERQGMGYWGAPPSPVQAAGKSSIPGMEPYDQATDGQDAHHTTVLGDGEGVVNFRAMQQPGVAQMIEQLNNQFPNPAAQLAPDSVPMQTGPNVQSGRTPIMADGGFTEEEMEAIRVREMLNSPEYTDSKNSSETSTSDPIKEEEKRIGSIIKFQEMGQKTQDPQVHQMIMKNLNQLGWKPPPPKPQMNPQMMLQQPQPQVGVYPGGRMPVMAPGDQMIMGNPPTDTRSSGGMTVEGFLALPEATQRALAEKVGTTDPESIIRYLRNPEAGRTSSPSSAMTSAPIREGSDVPLPQYGYPQGAPPKPEPLHPAVTGDYNYLNPANPDIFEIPVEEFRANPSMYESVTPASGQAGRGVRAGYLMVRAKEGVDPRVHSPDPRNLPRDLGGKPVETVPEEPVQKEDFKENSTPQERGQHAVEAGKASGWLSRNRNTWGSGDSAKQSERLGNILFPEGLTKEAFSSTNDKLISSTLDRERLVEAQRQWDEKMILDKDKWATDKKLQEALAESKSAALTWSKAHPEAWTRVQEIDQRLYDVKEGLMVEHKGDMESVIEAMGKMMTDDPALMKEANWYAQVMAEATGQPWMKMWIADTKEPGWLARAWWGLREGLNAEFDKDAKIAEYRASNVEGATQVTVPIYGSSSEETEDSYEDWRNLF